MTEQEPLQTKKLRKKLQKREQLILKRLKGAQQAQAKALDRFRRAEERLQNRLDRVQRIEGHLTLVQQQLNELNQSSLVPAAETGIPSWAQPITSSSSVTVETENITEPTDLATEARAAAEATEENTRLAAERAGAISQPGRTEMTEEPPQAMIEEPEEVAKIEAEEEILEAITAVTIAEIAAERAAAAEALAQASSAHTREARRRVQLAEQSLGEIRVAIRNGLLRGEEAEHALQEAEREVTHAQAYLADAEAAEEQALTAAMNAEAEAEVAEGMAYATASRSDPLLEEEQEKGNRGEATWEIFQSYSSQESVDESDITIKIPRVETQESE
jgi:hypothetical protein